MKKGEEMNEIERAEKNQIATQDINSLIDRFVKYVDVKPKSQETYHKGVRQFLLFLNENNITHPAREDVINFRSWMEQKGLKPSTRQLYLTSVRLFFSWLEQEGIYRNIADKVKAPKQDKSHKKSYLTADQCNELIESVKSDPRDYAILTLMLTTGLRTVEVVRANKEDLSNVGNQSVLFIQGKGKDDRRDYVKLDAEVEKAIRNYLKTRPDAKQNDPLFVGKSNHKTEDGRLTTRSISRIVKEALIRSGFNDERLTAHSLRHTTAHLNLENGGTAEETKELLRHSNIATTYIYIHEMDRERNNSEIRVADAIFRSGK